MEVVTVINGLGWAVALPFRAVMLAGEAVINTVIYMMKEGII